MNRSASFPQDFSNWPTEQVALWAVNDGDSYRVMTAAAHESTQELKRVGLALLRSGSAAWHLRRELVPSDYDRINWAEVQEQFLGE